MEEEKDFAFNAMVKEDEMIITIAEYEEMRKNMKILAEENVRLKDKCELMTNNENRKYQEIIEMKNKMRLIQNENSLIKRGIINFIKTLGGEYGQIR